MSSYVIVSGTERVATRDNREFMVNRRSTRIAFFFVAALLLAAGACHRNKSGDDTAHAKRYALKGVIVSIDKNGGTTNIHNDEIPGFMDPMVMPYNIKPPQMLDQLQVGDTITADVVVEPDKYWLENVKVTSHPQSPPAKPSASVHIPEPGEEVPDFHFVNQDGKRISLHQYRGATLLLTLIYTRCPFPDYCPRVSHEFAGIEREVRADRSRYGKTHLLSLSFDPAHDTPKVLRAYGFSCAGSKDPALFTDWEFAAIPQDELPQFAGYFALTYKEEGGLITHSLSTAVIGSDGKILRWYHGADWQASDLLNDIAAAHATS